MIHAESADPKASVHFVAVSASRSLVILACPLSRLLDLP